MKDLQELSYNEAQSEINKLAESFGERACREKYVKGQPFMSSEVLCYRKYGSILIEISLGKGMFSELSRWIVGVTVWRNTVKKDSLSGGLHSFEELQDKLDELEAN